MQILSLTCSKCGSPLEAPDGVRYLSCSFCGTRLQVQSSGGAVYTDILEDIESRTARIAADVDTIKLQNDLEQLDRDWMLAREDFMVSDRHGGRHIPSQGSSVLIAGAVVVFGLFWTFMAANMGAPAFFPLFGLIFVAVGLYNAVNTARKASAYAEAEARYEARRQELLDRLDRQRDGRSVPV